MYVCIRSSRRPHTWQEKYTQEAKELAEKFEKKAHEAAV
jgi:hypothetical protein